ncbi:MAG: DMT family transporter [Pseudomonadota bacterium]
MDKDRTLGIVLMAMAMLTIPLVDAVAKYLSTGHSALFISWARYLVAAVIILPIAFARHGRSCLPRRNLGAHFLRTVCLVTSMTLYFQAISTTPLADAISAYFIGPIVAALLAVWLLKETLSPLKIASMSLGFLGVILIVEPSTGISSGLILAIASGVVFAIYLVATRSASRQEDAMKTLAFQCLLGAVILTPQAVLTWQIPATSAFVWFVALGVLSLLSHFMSIQAFRFADTTTLSPLVYLEIIGSVLVGYLVFGDVPAVNVFVGAALVILAGVLLFKSN